MVSYLLLAASQINFGDTSNAYLGVLRQLRALKYWLQLIISKINFWQFHISLLLSYFYCPSVEKFFKDKTTFLHVDTEIVSSVVTSLDLRKTTGSDGLSARFIRASLYMVRLITVLLNKCIDSSSVPYRWNQAVVTPVPKCKQCSELSQFRRISVLPILSKVLERVLFNQIVLHLHKYKLLSALQSGFRAGYSTQDVFICHR